MPVNCFERSRAGQPAAQGVVSVIGGGNVAIEVASVLRAEDPTRDVTVVYRQHQRTEGIHRGD